MSIHLGFYLVSQLRLLFVIPILFLASFPLLVPPSAHANVTNVSNVGIWNDACLSANMTVANPVCAQNGVSLDPGTQVTVDVNVTNAPSFNGFEFALYFDPSNLTLSNVKFDKASGAMFDSPFVAQNDNSSVGVIRLGIVNLGAVASGSGVLAFLTFNIKGIGASPFVLGAGTCCPAQSPSGTVWTRLVFGGQPISVTTSDGYLQNNLEGELGPVAKFVFSPASPTLGTPVTFDASQSFDPDSPTQPGLMFSWDFGDGSLAGPTGNPVTGHVFQFSTPIVGNFSVRLTVLDSDNHFEAMVTHLVEVSPTPPICPLGLQKVQVPRDCPTIQTAIDTVATGGTVDVSAGIFNETLTISKSLKLIGAGGGLTTLTGGITIPASNVTVEGFRILNNNTVTGIYVHGQNVVASDDQVIGEPTSKYGILQGIRVFDAVNVSLTRNFVSNETNGVFIEYSPGSILRSNTLTNNTFNFDVSGSFIQDIDQSNSVDGKPIMYMVGTSFKQVPANAGYIAIVNSHDIQVGSASVNHEGEGITVFNSTRVIVNGLSADHVFTGASIVNSTAITFENGTVQNCGTGVDLEFNAGSSIASSKIDCNQFGVILSKSSSNIIQDNEILGLFLSASSFNHVTSNVIDGGLFLYNSPQNVFDQNQILSPQGASIGVISAHIECIFNPKTPCTQLRDYVQDISPTNTINGKPIYYLVNKQNVVVPSNAGFVASINSTLITISNVNISFDYQNVLVISSSNILIEDSNFTYAFREGVFAQSTSGLTIRNCNFLADGVGIRADSSTGGLLVGNNIQHSLYEGISLFNSTNYQVEGNYLSDYGYDGIRSYIPSVGHFVSGPIQIIRNTVIQPYPGPRFPYVVGIQAPTNALIAGNTIVGNYLGLGAPGNDTVYNNNFINNHIQAMGAATDKWDNGAGRGNYWSDYTGQDLNGDGIGDTLLPHLGLDNYPLMSPWMASGLDAKLSGRAAWPDLKRLVISKAGNGAETFNAQVDNTGASPEWVQAIFNITSSTGTVSQVVSQQVWLAPGATVILTGLFLPFPGSYKVTVTLRFSSDAYLKWNISTMKTFSFTATP